ncbi:alpha/beta fold hydrolase [Jiulongibacter sp. NS-SX5]|uniref:alpha/beta fold hydrolase n=1 Tax=Jiulongibacter sp. NS-SX5 TaxID=3463854 RepID=UPI004059032A
MKTQHLFLLLLVTSTLISCDAVSDISPLGNKKNRVSVNQLMTNQAVNGYDVKFNQTYGENRFQTYDLYIPKVDSLDPEKKSVSVVLVHGGGWSLLDKSYLNEAAQHFKNQNLNITIFNINHRLAGIDSVTFNDMMDDFDLFFDHHDSLKTSLNLSNEVVLWGYSSGGHLALSYAYKKDHKDIAAVTAVAAPTDLTEEPIFNGIKDDKNRNLTELLIGQPYQENPAAYKAASPYYDVDRNSSNTLLFYGGNDNLIPLSQGEKINAELNKKKIHAELHLIPEADHEMHGKMNQIVTETVEFMKTL